MMVIESLAAAAQDARVVVHLHILRKIIEFLGSEGLVNEQSSLKLSKFPTFSGI